MNCFVDTSALVAMADESDPNHSRAREQWEELTDSEELLIATNYVIVETLAVLQRRLGLQAVREFLTEVCPAIEVEWVEVQTHEEGVESLLSLNRNKLSLVDCVSFGAMRRMAVKRAFTFDSHFREQGFEALPAVPTSR